MSLLSLRNIWVFLSSLGPPAWMVLKGMHKDTNPVFVSSPCFFLWGGGPRKKTHHIYIYIYIPMVYIYIYIHILGILCKKLYLICARPKAIRHASGSSGQKVSAASIALFGCSILGISPNTGVVCLFEGTPFQRDTKRKPSILGRPPKTATHGHVIQSRISASTAHRT